MVDITPIINAVIALIATLITVFAIPYLKGKISEQKRKRMKEYIDVAVQAAEKLFPTIDGTKLGEEKLKYVADQLSLHGITFDANNIYDDVRMMIEAAVNEFCG